MYVSSQFCARFAFKSIYALSCFVCSCFLFDLLIVAVAVVVVVVVVVVCRCCLFLD